jgi:hypothetical protein
MTINGAGEHPEFEALQSRREILETYLKSFAEDEY